MDAVARQFELRWGRFLAVLFTGVVVASAAVEYLAPERYFREAAAVAEIELPFSGTKPPTA